VARTATVAPSVGQVAAAVTCVDAFDAEYEYVHRVLRRFNVRSADVEDVAQEVFLVLWRRWHEYDPSRPLRPWLAGIAYRVAYNHRTRSSREIPEPWLEETQDPDADPEKGRADADMRGVLARALDSLGEKQRSVVVLHDMDEIPMREIATLLEIPLYTAYSRLRVGRRRLLMALRRMQADSRRGHGSDMPGQLAEMLARERRPLRLAPDRKRNAIDRLRAMVPMLPLLAQTPDVPRRPRPRLLVAAAWTAAVIGVTGALVFGIVRTARPARDRPARTDAIVRAPVPSATTVAPPPALRLAAAPAPAAANSEALVGYWRLDDGAGSAYARDFSGGGNDCTLRRLDRGAAWTEGRHATAIQLDGRGWLECPQTATLNRALDEITIALWVKRTGPVKRVHALVTRQLGHGTKDAFHLGFRDDLLILQSSLWPVTLATAFPALGDGRQDRDARDGRDGRGDHEDRWHHVAATRGPDRRARL
jgi:RNA polymerase sigma-70 factor (ECF subfamily)